MKKEFEIVDVNYILELAFRDLNKKKGAAPENLAVTAPKKNESVSESKDMRKKR